MSRRLLAANLAPYLALLAGSLVFLATAGGRALDPRNVGWFMWGDGPAGYFGWIFFRGEPWHFPLGVIEGYGDGLGANIITTDSVPILALVFKPFHAFLPEPFQYFGMWLGLGFALQGLFAALVLRRLQVPPAQQLLGALLVVLSPVMLARAIQYPALASHWQIVAGIYLYQLDPLRTRTTLAWIVLLAVSSLTQAYIFPLVGSAWFASLVQAYLRDRTALRSLLGRGILTIAIVSVLMGLVGYASLASNASTGGYGSNQLNLLGWFNSRGASAFLPSLPLASPDQGEGFQYLGAGMLLVCISAVAGFIFSRQAGPVRERPWMPLIVAAAFWFAFAVSHQVTLGSHALSIPLPRVALEAAGAFRASGRMALLATYVLALAAIASCAVRFPRASLPLLALACAVQWLDVAPLRQHLGAFAAMARDGNPGDCGPLQGPRMPVTILPAVRIYGTDTISFWDLAVCAARRSMPINSAYLGRYDVARYMANAKAVDHSMIEEPPRADRYYAYRNEAIPRAMGLPSGFGARVGAFHVFSGSDALAARSRAGLAGVATSAPLPWRYALKTVLAPGVPDHLLSGWSNVVPDGVWTDGAAGRILVPVPEGYASLTALRIYGHAYSADGEQSVEVLVNGTSVGAWNIKSLAPAAWRSVQVPPEAFRGHAGYALIELRIAKPSSYDSGTISDRRRLGMFVAELGLDSLFAEWPGSLAFNDGGNGAPLLDTGWSSPEPWGTWSDGDVAVIRVGATGKPRPARLRFELLASSATGVQRTRVRVNGEEVATWEIPSLAKPEWREIELPESARAPSQPLVMEFIPATPGPPPVPGNTDTRRLGIGLLRIEAVAAPVAQAHRRTAQSSSVATSGR